ncbi:polyhydroxyalkanoic acid system family protein [Bacteriovorax sp. Seq25_V]|uniref:polyhydroxyalkanoic acid system family protein n=1 Tax=Bacteriovorax sp. Seq25_V TaxID=1201288 RepID=UPI00038A075F|nr:polyhydroxyalkanoic acid system family protein [Bacteriovorax sp. Seq25_V]EQC46309.1 putative polyhydroxyalkanoic acid system protein [Bacteriovorax sp. Seq25_V]
MDLNVNYNIAKSATEAYDLAKEQITPDYVAKFNVPCDIDYSPGSTTISAKGKGFTLTLVFEEDRCAVKLELSFLLRPVRGKVLDTIENKLKKTV